MEEKQTNYLEMSSFYESGDSEDSDDKEDPNETFETKK